MFLPMKEDSVLTLAKHRRLEFKHEDWLVDCDLQVNTGRRATSLDLPMAMRYRHLAKNARAAVGVYASNIHGIGLFCKREISAGEMVREF